jgi:hypothetical protein
MQFKCLVSDNATSANGAIAYASYFDAKYKYLSLSKHASCVFAESDVDYVELGVSGFNSSVGGRVGVRERIVSVVPFFARLYAFYKRLRAAKALIKKSQISELLVSSDRSHANGYLMPLICAAIQLRMPVNVVEYADFADEERLAEVRVRRAESINTSLLAKLFFKKHILKSSSGEEVLMYPISLLAVWWVNGCLSKTPSVVGGVDGVGVLVRNERTYERLVEAGVKKANVVLIPNFYIQKSNTKKREGFDISIAVPQLFEHDLCSYEKALDIHKSVFRIFGGLNVKAVLLLHPKMNKTKYEQLARKYNANIYCGSSHEAVSNTRVFINTYSSLTHEAIESGAEVHIFDPIGLRYNMFKNYVDISYSEDISGLINYLKEKEAEFL